MNGLVTYKIFQVSWPFKPSQSSAALGHFVLGINTIHVQRTFIKHGSETYIPYNGSAGRRVPLTTGSGSRGRNWVASHTGTHDMLDMPQSSQGGDGSNAPYWTPLRARLSEDNGCPDKVVTWLHTNVPLSRR